MATCKFKDGLYHYKFEGWGYISSVRIPQLEEWIKEENATVKQGPDSNVSH